MREARREGERKKGKEGGRVEKRKRRKKREGGWFVP